MTISSVDSPTIVIDAGLAAITIRPDSSSGLVQELWAGWRAAGAELYAPHLWRYEVTAFVRKSLALGEIELEEAQAGLTAALALDITLVPADEALCLSALTWAGRLKQKVAYDGFYLALASRLQADFWSTDRRLVNSARQTGVRWVHWVGEFATGAA